MTPRTLLAFLVLASAGGCDCGEDTELVPDGDADADGDGDGDGDGDAECGEEPCTDHEGEQAFVEEGAPAESAELFADATLHPSGDDPTREPAIVYPSHETMFPINVSRIRHEWSAAGTATLYELVFEGPATATRIYTRTTDWEPSEDEWDWIAESNRGEAVTWTVHALDEAAPDDVWQSAPITLYFSRAAVQGAIYYWSTGSKGVMKGLVSSPIPIKFYTDPLGEDGDTCVACHTVSRDGTRLAVGYGGERLREVSIPDRELILPLAEEDAIDSSWTTFSPDNSMILVAARGTMTLLDADTGAPIGDDEGVVPIPDDLVATHPDWSALGDRVVFTLATDGGAKDTNGGSIAILPFVDGAWGEPDVIVQSTGERDNNFFPRWSPDSEWIAYVHAEGSSKDERTSVLRLVAAAGGEPVLLARLNGRVNNVDGVVEIGNTMPTWAPSTRPGIFWLALSSLREYATLAERDDNDQLWIAAVDVTADDPGFAAFWAPFQSIEEGNHRAFWAHSAEDTPCHCAEFCDDELDNDCDGTADEADCTVCAAEEICGDDLDNDCDCAVDECVEEICDDGIDNDVDGLTDGDDGDCLI